ncbi:hypothetical protein K488DRAFT_9834, partial [Vararia minispora EC-137]
PTTMELARECAARTDPLAEVLNPLYINCRVCGKTIKLSEKQYFDLLHWTQHRRRCLSKHQEPEINQAVHPQRQDNLNMSVPVTVSQPLLHVDFTLASSSLGDSATPTVTSDSHSPPAPEPDVL